MVKINRQFEHSLVKENRTTKQREDYKSFYLKKTTWEAICLSRGWHKRGAISRFAESINITRQYACDLVNQNVGCSSNVMRRIIDLLGLNGGCWCHLFSKVNDRHIDPNHPIFNQQKHNGEIPYNRYSESAELRNKDYKTEVQK